MAWSAITSVVTYSAGNAIPVTNTGAEPISVTVKRPASGADVIVTFYADGAPVHTMTTSASDPIKTSAFAAPGATSLNYSTDRAFASPGASISSSTEASAPNATPSGDVQFGRAVTAAKYSRQSGSIARTNLPRRVRAITFGHSFDAFTTQTNATLDPIVATIPGGSTPTQPIFNGTKIAIMARTHSLNWVGCYGIAGKNTTEMLARSAEVYSTSRKSLYDASTAQADLGNLGGPIVNDAYFNWNENTTLATVDATVENAKIIISRLAETIPHVAFLGCAGLSVAAWTEAKRAGVAALLEYAVRKLAAWAEDKPNIHFLDPEGRLSVKQIWIAGLSDDGVHPNVAGGGVWADMVEELVDSLWEVTNADPIAYDYDLLWNTVSSGRPSGLSVVNVSGAVAGAATTVNGIYEQPFTTPDAAGAIYLDMSSLRAALIAGGFVSGDAFYVEMGAELLDADGNPADYSASYVIRLFNAANEAGNFIPQLSASRVHGASRITTANVALDRDASLLGTSTLLRLICNPGAAGSWTLRMTAPRLRKYAP